MTPDSRLLDDRIRGSMATIGSLRDQLDQIGSIISAVASCLDADGAVYTCGNGGSAAEALHLAEELTGRYKDDRPPKRAVCLNADSTALTCISNDFGFDEVFARQIEGLSRPGDALVAFSTSGNSANIVHALERSRRRGVVAIGLLGKSGGPALEHCDHALVVASDDTAHIQEAHQVVLHLILESIEHKQA